ncbi:hypothetical protein evm_013645 [Chilo suppressalis]|nr:hypothetical protein evm_013645 [Chilo suppressalis]
MYYSSDDSEHESDFVNYENNLQLREDIKMWAIKYNIPHSAYNELSLILNKNGNIILPKDARTLFQTSQDVQIIPSGTGNYWYNGLIKQLKKIIECANDLPDNISLNFNIDGLPLYKSSRQQFWPILCNISEMPRLPPLIISIYTGSSKPSNLESFFGPLIMELNELTSSNGLTVTVKSTGLEKTIPVKVRAFICDSPARALIKGVVNFNGKHGCLKCTVIGEYSHVSRTVTFLNHGCPKRNDNDFRSKNDEEHHKQDSPLLKLNIDMVEDFPVCDSLHLIDLGVMKRLLTGWRDGNFGKYLTKWCSQDIEKVNDFLTKCSLPKEIHRSVRKLDVLAHWKGSEYRTFFYYLGIVILKDTLPSQAYYHFLLLFCAVTICSNEKYFKFLSIAEKMLQIFIDIYKNIYGKDYISSNIHNLSHLVDEVKKFGVLQSFNAYPFENKLYGIKKMIRQGNKPLQQAARRLSERSDIEFENIGVNENRKPFIKKNKTKRRSTVKQLCFDSFSLSAQDQNKWFLSNNDEIIKLQSLTTDDDSKDILIHGYRIDNVFDVFEEPLKSSFLNIYKCDLNNYNKTEVICDVTKIKCKLVKIEYNSELFFIPLLHTL